MRKYDVCILIESICGENEFDMLDSIQPVLDTVNAKTFECPVKVMVVEKGGESDE